MQPPSNDGESSVSGALSRKTAEPFNDSGAVSENVTKIGKGSMGMSPPQSSSVGTGGEVSGEAVNLGGVGKQALSESLLNSAGRDGGVQWQQHSSS